MRLTILLSLYFFLIPQTYAQNWTTVPVADTGYFAAGSHSAGLLFGTDSNYLRTIFIRSTQASGSDTNFYFFHNLRMPDISACTDTAAPAWLGSHFTRKQDGTEYYFNSFNDTITIRTNAPLNSSWLLATDTAGVAFTGTIAQTGIMNIEGVADSFKTIHIQAFKNGTPYAHWYNNKQLQWSKDHGWINTLELYSFPNILRPVERIGTVTDSGQHRRLDKFARFDLNGRDVNNIYVPGNEWIYTRENAGISPNSGYYPDKFVTHDSILNVFPLSPSSALVAFKTDTFHSYWRLSSTLPPQYIYHQNPSGSYIHVDTVSLITQPYLPATYNILPEVKDAAMSLNNISPGNAVVRYFFGNTICGDKYIFKKYNYSGIGLNNNSGCIKFSPGVSGFKKEFTAYLQNFGIIARRWEEGDYINQPALVVDMHYDYIKMSSCIYGTKFNVLTLDIDNTHKPVQRMFKVYPNPATDKVTIATGVTHTGAMAVLYNLTGQRLQAINLQYGNTDMNTAAFPSGMYILDIKTKEKTERFKISIIK